MNKKVKIMAYLIVLIVLVGCKSKSYNKEVLKKQDIAPKTLKELNSEIDSIMLSVGDIERIILDIEVKEDKNESEDEKEKVTENKDQNNPSEEGSKGQDSTISTQEGKDSLKEDKVKDKDQEEIITKKIQDKWKEIDSKVEGIYSLWNKYGVKAIKKGATTEDIKEVEASLNKLIKGIEDRQTLTVYNYGSKSFKALEAFYAFYKDEIGGEVLSLKYILYQYYINAVKGSKSTANMYIENSDQYLNKIKLKLEDKKDHKEKIETISFEFRSLSDVLEEDSRRIFILKKDILVKNLNSLEN